MGVRRGRRFRGAARLLAACGIAACTALPAGAQPFAVAPGLWDRPRAATGVIGDPAVRRAVAAWLARPGGIVVRHGPGQESLLQAEELRAWLIALAVEAQGVTLRGDLKAGEPLQIEAAGGQ